MAELTYEELKEELRREQVTNELSNKSIIKLLGEKKELQALCQKQEEEIQNLTATIEEAPQNTCDVQIEEVEESVSEKMLILETQLDTQQSEILTQQNQIADKQALLEVRDHKVSELEVSIARLEEEKKQLEEAKAQAEERLAYELKRMEVLAETKGVDVGDLNPKTRNSRGAGRKKAATPETVQMVLKLRETGVSYVKISQVLKERLGVELGRTTVGEIVRGNYLKDDPSVSKDQLIS